MKGGKAYRYFLLPEVSDFLTAGFYYWTFGANYIHDHKTVAIVGSPMNSVWLVIYKGIVAPITLDQDFWMDGDAFVSTAYRGRLPFSDVVQQALVKIEGYKAAIQAHENPLSAMAKHLFGEQDFDKRFEKAFSTVPGKKFYGSLQTAQKPEDFHRAAMTYLTEIKDNRSFSLMEILLAEAILYRPDGEK